MDTVKTAFPEWTEYRKKNGLDPLGMQNAGHEGRNSLAGSELSSVRGFLNRVLGLGQSDDEPDVDEDALARSFDLGDETGDAAGALETGADFSEPVRAKQGVDDEAERQSQAIAIQRRANREDLIRAVAALQERIAAKAKSDGLRTIDLLRLRAMLMVIATAGWDGQSETRSAIQVLPPAGDVEAAWPRLLGKSLFSYFGGNAAPIRTLLLDEDFVQLPEDVLECWATCMWAVQAVTLKSQEHREYGRFQASVEAVKQTIYLITALAPAELLDQHIMRVFQALNGRFARRLPLDPVRVIANHRCTADALRACAA